MGSNVGANELLLEDKPNVMGDVEAFVAEELRS